MPTLTRKKFEKAFTEARHKIAEWDQSGPTTTWRDTAGIRMIDEKLVDAWFSLFELAATKDVEPILRPAILALDEFERALEDWSAEFDIDPVETPPSGDAKLWNTWHQFVDAMTSQVPTFIESVKTLTTQGVPDRQICVMYGWVDDNGNPEIDKLHEEREKPGTHYDAKKWIPPRLKKLFREIEPLWEKRIITDHVKPGEKPAFREAPETVEELLNQRVPSKQIAMMKNITVEEVRSIAAKAGLPVDSEILSPSAFPTGIPEVDLEAVRTADNAAHQARQQEAGKNKANAQPTIVDRVLALAETDKTIEQIQSELSKDFPQITVEQIGAIIEKVTTPL